MASLIFHLFNGIVILNYYDEGKTAVSISLFLILLNEEEVAVSIVCILNFDFSKDEI